MSFDPRHSVNKINLYMWKGPLRVPCGSTMENQEYQHFKKIHVYLEIRKKKKEHIITDH